MIAIWLDFISFTVTFLLRLQGRPLGAVKSFANYHPTIKDVTIKSLPLQLLNLTQLQDYLGMSVLKSFTTMEIPDRFFLP